MLYSFEFSRNIKMHRVFENQLLLQEYRRQSRQAQTLPIVAEIYGEMLLPKAPENRPYTYCSLVSTLDGRIAYENDPVSTYIARDNFMDHEGGVLNFWSLMMQRAHADAIITAAKTLQSEPEGTLHICDSTLLKERAMYLGRSTKHPLNLVVSRRGQDIPFQHKIFHSQAEDLHTVLVVSPFGAQNLQAECGERLRFRYVESEDDLQTQAAELEALLWNPPVDKLLTLVVGQQDAEIETSLLLLTLRTLGIEHLFIESPQYMYHLMDYDLLDEFFMDFSLVFAGGGIVAGQGHEYSTKNHPHTSLVCASVHSSHFLYTRHKMLYGVGEDTQK